MSANDLISSTGLDWEDWLAQAGMGLLEVSIEDDRDSVSNLTVCL